jgi:hypothetical protein
LNPKESFPAQSTGIVCFLIAVSAATCSFLWQGHVGFNLWDEGFLWYGAQRVMLGEVPILDFMAYDPGRYYWSATLMGIYGDNGIMSLRGAVAVFQAVGLFSGLLLIAQTMQHPGRDKTFYLLLSAVTLVMWMFPRHKLFDTSLSLLLIGILTFLVHKPSARRYLIAGVCTGLVAVFGRNHGMYGVAGSLGVMAWLGIQRSTGPSFLKGSLLWAIGIAIGFTPVLFIALVKPGFALAFWENIRLLFEAKATNLSLPVPWPWRVNLASASIGEALRGVLVGLFFIGMPVFGVLSILWIIRKRLQNAQVSPALVATAFLALPYAHFAYSRADVGHLAQGVFPLLVGCLLLLSTQSPKMKWGFALALCMASAWVMHVFHPGWQCQSSQQCVNVEISGRSLKIDPGTAREIAWLRHLIATYAPDGRNFIATPFWPGAYALLEQKSPMWEIYALWPRAKLFEQREIERIQAANPAVAIVLDLPLDGRNELRFSNTHPLTSQYILRNFDRLPDSNSPGPGYQAYKIKEQAR